MSTKNLARTVIEGGRNAFNRWDRRQSHREERAAARAALAHIGGRRELDDLVVERRRPVYKCFDDRLGPTRRWLVSHAGQRWDLVRGELLRQFDTRTTAGRHVVFDHMLPDVEDCQPWFPTRFFVDGAGILRTRPRKRLRHRWREPLPRPQVALERWLDGRRVAPRGEILFWFVLTPGGGYRQHHRLSDDDAQLWRSLPAWYRELHDPTAPPPVRRI
jgi:hypothetical protein